MTPAEFRDLTDEEVVNGLRGAAVLSVLTWAAVIVCVVLMISWSVWWSVPALLAWLFGAFIRIAARPFAREAGRRELH